MGALKNPEEGGIRAGPPSPLCGYGETSRSDPWRDGFEPLPAAEKKELKGF